MATDPGHYFNGEFQLQQKKWKAFTVIMSHHLVTSPAGTVVQNVKAINGTFTSGT